MGDYPTKEQLAQIRAWDHHDFNGLIDFIRPLFEPMGRIWQDGNGTYLATGGWSGNEDIIGAILENWMVRALYYAEWKRGGLHVFRTMTGDSDPPLPEAVEAYTAAISEAQVLRAEVERLSKQLQSVEQLAMVKAELQRIRAGINGLLGG